MTAVSRLCTLALTAAALVCFAANSLLCRAALRPRLVDAATFTSIRLLAGAAALALIVAVSRRAPPAGGSLGSGFALFLYAASCGGVERKHLLPPSRAIAGAGRVMCEASADMPYPSSSA